MVILDAFVLSHTSEAVDIPDQDIVDRFLPLPPINLPYKIDIDEPHSFGALTSPDHYFEIRCKIQKAMEESVQVAKDVDAEFQQIIGRGYGVIETYRCEDAKLILVTSGTITGTARMVVDSERVKGRKVGLLKIRMFRPFPIKDLREILPRAQKIAVIDRNIGFGHSGIFCQEIKSALYGLPVQTPIFGFIIGMGGRDVTTKDIEEIVDFTFKSEKPDSMIIWRGVRL